MIVSKFRDLNFDVKKLHLITVNDEILSSKVKPGGAILVVSTVPSRRCPGFQNTFNRLFSIKSPSHVSKIEQEAQVQTVQLMHSLKLLISMDICSSLKNLSNSNLPNFGDFFLKSHYFGIFSIFCTL